MTAVLSQFSEILIMGEYLWLAPAVLCGLIALVGNIVLGQQVLQRQIIFIDLAVAQVAALGANAVPRFAKMFFFSQHGGRVSFC